MKSRHLIFMTVALIAGAFLLLAGPELLWQAAQLPGLHEISQRMNDQGLQQRFAGDPLRELARNTAQGDYRFHGLMDPSRPPNWVPGMPEGSYPAFQVDYLVTDHKQAWLPAAEGYFAAYNRALVVSRTGKRLDTSGTSVR